MIFESFPLNLDKTKGELCGKSNNRNDPSAGEDSELYSKPVFRRKIFKSVYHPCDE